MKALFNSTCGHCGEFKPRCATVAMYTNESGYRRRAPIDLCEECRKLFRNRYMVHPKHRDRRES